MESALNSNTFNEKDVSDVIIEEKYQVEVSATQIYVTDETENVDVSAPVFFTIIGLCHWKWCYWRNKECQCLCSRRNFLER